MNIFPIHLLLYNIGFDVYKNAVHFNMYYIVVYSCLKYFKMFQDFSTCIDIFIE